jgi:pyridoxal phosphate enzyme (YggS family)
MTGVSIENRLQKIRDRVAAACARAGRDANSVKILAVSKGQDFAQIRQAALCGQNFFGENYAQEATEKMEKLEGLPLAWHFIGRIQSNKIKHLVGRFAVIHSVDRLNIAEAISAASSTPQEIFLQYNVADEVTKAGAAEAGLAALAFKMGALPNIRLTGLMVMPPLSSDLEEVRPYFKKARALATNLGLNELSMGTSSDFEVAIEEGATWIRTGTEIFGPRPGAV